MFFRQLMALGVVLILTLALNGCALFFKEVKLEDIPSAVAGKISGNSVSLAFSHN